MSLYSMIECNSCHTQATVDKSGLNNGWLHTSGSHAGRGEFTADYCGLACAIEALQNLYDKWYPGIPKRK